MNIETLIYPLIAAGAGGLGFIAYHHPNGYKKIFNTLVPFVLLGLSVAIISLLGALYASVRSLGQELINNPERTIEFSSYHITSMNSFVDYIAMVLVIGIVLIGYLFFLLKLPNILNN